MGHSTFNKSGVPRSRNAQMQMRLDDIHTKNEKKWRAELKERRRIENAKTNGLSLANSVDNTPKSRRL